MNRASKITTLATIVGLSGILGVSTNSTLKRTTRWLPDYIRNSVEHIFLGESPEITPQYIDNNTHLSFRTAENELVSEWYALLSSSQNSLLETGKYDKPWHTYIGHLRARTVTGVQEIVKELRILWKDDNIKVLITGAAESWSHNEHIERWKSHSEGYKLDLSFSSKMWFNSSSKWLLPWLQSKIGTKPVLGKKYSFHLTSGQRVDVFYEKDHLDIRFL